MYPRNFNFLGAKFGRWTVIDNKRINYKKILCKCECGNEKLVDLGLLKIGESLSCGCLRKQMMQESMTTHHMSNTRVYNTWTKMKERCNNRNVKSYKNYGGRGIEVCEEWSNSFESFHEWSITSGYADEFQIDRIDVNGNYEPSNCRWVTSKVNANNKRNTKWVTINGVTRSASEWIDITGVRQNLMYDRLRRGWKGEDLFLPKMTLKRKRTYPK